MNPLNTTALQTTGERATAAMAAKAKATVEARYAIAFQPVNRRQFDVVRQAILSSCKRPEFAEAARYKKPVGGSFIEGFSIRFAEEAIKAMKNIAVESSTIYEDESVRTVQINVTDLENNITYGKEITVQKTVERKKLKDGQVPISQRTNTNGQITYTVEATEDDIANKIASAESKVIRNCGLRLVPSDILEEAERAIDDTLVNGGTDPKADVKKLVDAFATLNVSVEELGKYLGHAIETVSPKEKADLRAVFTSIKDGAASWSDYVIKDEAEKPTKPAIAKAVKEKPAAAPVLDVKATPAEAPAPAATEPAAPPAQSAKEKLLEIVERDEILFEPFVNWIRGLGQNPDGWKDWDDVTEEAAAFIVSEKKRINNMKTLCGKD